MSATALLLVDIQNDFCAGGALAVPDADAIMPVVNQCVEHARQAGWPIIASRDWHPREHCSFTAQGGDWPEHCVQDTPGARYHPDLRLPDEAIRVSKGCAFDRDNYSAFEGTGLASYLQRHGITSLKVAGLALDVCVQATVREARELGFEVELIAAGTRAVEPEQAALCKATLRELGATIAES